MQELPPMLRALLDARDEAIVIVDPGGAVVYLNAAARATRAAQPRTSTRSHFLARGGRAVPLRLGAAVLGEVIFASTEPAATWADQERRAIRDALAETGGKRSETARRLGISRTTLWRRLKAG
jgi:transcriptional regulator with PAS, ATPase and Fis domain